MSAGQRQQQVNNYGELRRSDSVMQESAQQGSGYDRREEDQSGSERFGVDHVQAEVWQEFYLVYGPEKKCGCGDIRALGPLLREQVHCDYRSGCVRQGRSESRGDSGQQGVSLLRSKGVGSSREPIDNMAHVL